MQGWVFLDGGGLKGPEGDFESERCLVWERDQKKSESACCSAAGWFGDNIYTLFQRRELGRISHTELLMGLHSARVCVCVCTRCVCVCKKEWYYSNTNAAHFSPGSSLQFYTTFSSSQVTLHFTRQTQKIFIELKEKKKKISPRMQQKKFKKFSPILSTLILMRIIKQIGISLNTTWLSSSVISRTSDWELCLHVYHSYQVAPGNYSQPAWNGWYWIVPMPSRIP